MKSVGYIGLGIMGAPMAENLMNAGFGVTVWNRSREKVRPLVDAGAASAETPATLAAEVDAVCVNVTDTPDVEEVLFGADGVAEGGRSGLIVVDHSTISPAATRDFARRLGEKGIDLVDAPVSGGDVGARAGTLSIMAGGTPAAFEACRPLFETVGKNITHVGSTGAGQATKACNQVLCAVNLVAVCEAMGLAVREGVDLDRMLEVTAAGAGGSWALANLGPKIAQGDHDPGFMIDLINKDLNIVYEEGRDLGLPMPGTRQAAELFRVAATAGHGREGTQALCRVFEKLAEMRYSDGR